MRYIVTIVNPDVDVSKEVEVGFANLKGTLDSVKATIINGEKMNSINTFEKGDAVVEKTQEAKIIDKQTVSVNVPAHSVVSVTVYA